MEARGYQAEGEQQILAAYASGYKRVLYVLPTGGGKTFMFSALVKKMGLPTVALVHRRELVIQMSVALANNEIPHRIIGPRSLVTSAQKVHAAKFGRVWVDPRAQVAAASVQTIVSRKSDPWLKTVTFWVTDEAHHVQPDNQWGRAIDLLSPNAQGLGVTATPARADRRGLGNTFDTMIVGPSPRDLMDQGYLCDYIIYAPPTENLRLDQIPVGADGDYIRKHLKKNTRDSGIVGDVVYKYLQYAAGKLGVTFTTDVETATEVANSYRANGVPAEVLTAKTPLDVRSSIIQRFESRSILQLVTVDIVSEGFDLPALEVASLARPTASKSLCDQQVGRVLRPMPGKERAIIIDHVGNMVRHLPAEYTWHKWVLEVGRRRKKDDEEDVPPIKACPSCSQVFERHLSRCPWCLYAAPPAKRSSPRVVDGDLQELDPAVFERLMGAREDVDKPLDAVAAEMEAKHAPHIGVLSQVKRHRLRQEAQAALRAEMARFGGLVRGRGLTRVEGQKLFFIKYGVDVLSAQSLGAADADKLTGEIQQCTTI